MNRSQNVIFNGLAEADVEFNHPPGASIIRLLSDELPAYDWNVSEFDNWIDTGWMIECSRENNSLNIVLGEFGDAESWMIQISPSRVPSFLMRWFGAMQSADSDAIFHLSCDVHAVLQDYGFEEFRWMWDGPPKEKNATPEPQAAK